MNKDLISELTAITPIDGRYKKKTKELSDYLSEFSLIKYRVEIEIKYLILLSEYKVIRKISAKEKEILSKIYLDFSLYDAIKVKRLEEETRHDMKAIERFLRNSFNKSTLSSLSESIHIFISSDDVNNLAYRLMLQNAINKVFLTKYTEINNILLEISKKHKTSKMLARTHGQAALPTTYGKEIYVFYKRLEREINSLKKRKLTGKLNGAVGNYNSFYFVFPKVNWIKFSKDFVASFGFVPNIVSTQINPYEDVIQTLQNLQRINGILIDLNQDAWRYISDDWLKLAIKENEVGSSTMPQKVNPIDFENSEGNLTLANGLMQSMIDKLYISRLQRDLSNSTVIRNLGTVLGFCLLAYKSLLFGLSRIDVNKEKMLGVLNKDWSILSEGLQTYLRSKNFHNAYFFVSSFTRGKKIDEKSWRELINSLIIPEPDKQKLLKLTPESYIGIAEKLVI
jgi:adenylosuccinate lyase